MKAFFHYLAREERIEHDPSENLKAPKIEKKLPGDPYGRGDRTPVGTAVGNVAQGIARPRDVRAFVRNWDPGFRTDPFKNIRDQSES